MKKYCAIPSCNQIPIRYFIMEKTCYMVRLCKLHADATAATIRNNKKSRKKEKWEEITYDEFSIYKLMQE